MEIIRKVKSDIEVGALVEEIRNGSHKEKYQVGDILVIGGIGHVIIGMDVEDGFPHSMTVQRHDKIKDYVFAESGRNDYNKSDVRAYLNGEYKEDLPVEFVEAIKPVQIDGMDGEDLFFLLSADDLDLEDSKYPFYHSRANRTHYDEDGFAAWWWLRDPYTGYSYIARYVYTTGNIYFSYAGGSGGVAPACVIA